jgi:hypothetical protein
MNTVVKLSNKQPVTFTAFESRIWRAALWQSPSGIPWLPSGDTTRKEVFQVFVNGKPLTDVKTLDGVRSWEGLTAGAWAQDKEDQDGVYLYVCFRHDSEIIKGTASAQEWLFEYKTAGLTIAYTDGDFWYGGIHGNIPYRSALISGYTQ